MSGVSPRLPQNVSSGISLKISQRTRLLNTGSFGSSASCCCSRRALVDDRSLGLDPIARSEEPGNLFNPTAVRLRNERGQVNLRLGLPRLPRPLPRKKVVLVGLLSKSCFACFASVLLERQSAQLWSSLRAMSMALPPIAFCTVAPFHGAHCCTLAVKNWLHQKLCF